MLGLYAFFYAALHFATYAALDQGFDFKAILADIVKRPFILVGFTAFVLLVPLAMTSTATDAEAPRLRALEAPAPARLRGRRARRRSTSSCG